MTENMENMIAASNLVTYMISLLRIYEAGVLQGPANGGESFSVTLTQDQINTLKARFATARTACKACLDAVTA